MIAMVSRLLRFSMEKRVEAWEKERVAIAADADTIVANARDAIRTLSEEIANATALKARVGSVSQTVR